MGRKHCGKRRNGRHEQFLLFPQCFQKACFPGASKGVIVWEWVIKQRIFDSSPNSSRLQMTQILAQMARFVSDQILKTLWKKEKMLVTSIFSFFSQCLLPYQGEKSFFLKTSIFAVCKCFQFGPG